MSHGLISHVGIAVKDLAAAVEAYRRITGCEPVLHEVKDQHVRAAMFGPSGAYGVDARLELLEATSDSSPVARFIDRQGEGLHHICLYVDDLDKRLSELKQAGVRLVDEKPRTGADGARIAFVHPASLNGVLIELEERRG